MRTETGGHENAAGLRWPAKNVATESANVTDKGRFAVHVPGGRAKVVIGMMTEIQRGGVISKLIVQCCVSISLPTASNAKFKVMWKVSDRVFANWRRL